MKNRIRMISLGSLLLVQAAILNAEYTETMNPKGLMRDLRTDYGVDGKGAGNDSAKLQQAIDDVAHEGGGRVLVPKGIYHVAGVDLRSDVHLLFDKGAIVHPYIEGSVQKMTMFHMGVNCDRVVNTSIRGVGGQFTVQIPKRSPGMTVIRCAYVKNFLISNIRINDARSVYSSLAFGLSGPNGRLEGYPEDGTVENASAYDSHYGYGLVQTQAAKSVLFRNLYSEGGVALRLETGWNRMNDLQVGGVQDITGKNIFAKNGHCAVLAGPHAMQNGVITVDGIRSESCGFAVKVGGGYVNKHQKNPNIRPGTFAAGSSLKNIHAVFGTNAQLKDKDVRMLPDALQEQVRTDADSGGISRGPSVAAVLNTAPYPIEVRNVTYEGFKFGPAVLKMTREEAFRRRNEEKKR
ncbi:MAG TPA: glycosyl hydrolase family 28-related protein [Phycisphaerae bacterium]|nr:glycosyl hydrolase family 28-related protein [Phycisphaerae bacterium]